MKKYKIIYEVKQIEQNKNSKLIRIIKDNNGKTYRIRIGVPVATPNEIECHYWNSNEWAFVCGKYDLDQKPISPYDVNLELLIQKCYDNIMKFINCLE